MTSPNPRVQPPAVSYLQGISCASTSSCLASGASGNPANSYPLAEHWNGTAWSITPTQRP